MSRISKELAQQIATKLTEKSKKYVDELLKERNELVTSLYEATIPKNIMDMWSKDSTYFTTTSYVEFSGHGFSYERVPLTRKLPSNYTEYRANLELNAKTAEKIVKAKNKHQKEKKNYEILFEETERALLALKTYNNIRKELPDAAPFLPPPLSNALVVNFDSLKNKLHKQPEIKQKVEVN